MSDDGVRDITNEAKGGGITGGAIVAILATVAVAAFILQNTDRSEFTLFFWDVTIPVWLLAAILFLLGWVAGYYAKHRKVKARRKAMK